MPESYTIHAPISTPCNHVAVTAILPKLDCDPLVPSFQALPMIQIPLYRNTLEVTLRRSY